MPSFGHSSQAKLNTCHPLLQALFHEVIQSEVKNIKEHAVETRKIANHAHDRLSEYIAKK